MEKDRNRATNLTRRRWEGFLLGFVVVLATCFVAIEYNSVATDSADEMLLEELAKDLEMLPAMEQERMLAEVNLPEEQVVTPEINVVEEPTNELDILDELTESGDDEPATEEEEPPQQKSDTDEQALDMRVVEELPEFPGGMAHFIKWLTKNIIYPTALREQKRGGQMVASFIINTDGSVSDIAIVKSFDLRCDNAVKSVLERMPAWKPGTNQGKPCRTMMVIPLDFRM